MGGKNEIQEQLPLTLTINHIGLKDWRSIKYMTCAQPISVRGLQRGLTKMGGPRLKAGSIRPYTGGLDSIEGIKKKDNYRWHFSLLPPLVV